MNRWRAEYDDGIWLFYRDGMELGLYEKGDVVIDALNNAESRIAELEEKQRWIPVSERMPEDGEHVLAAYVDTMLTAAYYRHHIAFGGVDNWWDVEGCHTGNPTHWLPLPVLPESPNDTQMFAFVYGKDVSRSVK